MMAAGLGLGSLQSASRALVGLFSPVKKSAEFFAFWGEHPQAFELFEKHKLKPQIWTMLPQPEGG